MRSALKRNKQPHTKPSRKTDYMEEPKIENQRLNRFIANAGVCSRREADGLIEKGYIKVNSLLHICHL